MGLQMKVTFFLAVALTTLLNKASANNESKSCNVGRSGKPPINARSCDELENGSFLITPCSDEIEPCLATRSDITFQGGCADTTPSTTTPQQVLHKAIERFVKNRKNTKLATKLSEIKVEKNEPSQILFAQFNNEINIEAIESKLFNLSNNKTMKNKYNSLIASNVNYGWIGFKLENSKFVPFNVSNIIPKCDTSPKSVDPVPTSKK
jgi:hypothetical protein